MYILHPDPAKGLTVFGGQTRQLAENLNKGAFFRYQLNQSASDSWQHCLGPEMEPGERLQHGGSLPVNKASNKAPAIFLESVCLVLGVCVRSMAQTSREWGTPTWWPSSRKAEMRPGCWWWTLRLTPISRRGGSFPPSPSSQVGPDWRRLKHNVMF